MMNLYISDVRLFWNSDAWLTQLIPSRLALSNADHIVMSILFSLVFNVYYVLRLLQGCNVYYNFDRKRSKTYNDVAADDWQGSLDL